MFAKDSQVYLVTQDKLINYGDVLANMYDPQYPRKSQTGKIEKWSANMFTCNTIPTIGVFTLSQINRGAFFIIDPIDGKVVKEYDDIYDVLRPKNFRASYPFYKVSRLEYDKMSRSEYKDEKEAVVLVYLDGRIEAISLDGTTIDREQGTWKPRAVKRGDD
jgi:hypothetical protein